MQVLSKRTFERNGYTYTVSRIHDESPDLSYLEQDYADETEHLREQYKEQDRKRLEAYHNDEWSMIGITVDITVQTAAGWASPPVVGRSSLWGIESDSDEAYLAEREEELISEAEADIDLLRKAICK